MKQHLDASKWQSIGQKSSLGQLDPGRLDHSHSFIPDDFFVAAFTIPNPPAATSQLMRNSACWGGGGFPPKMGEIFSPSSLPCTIINSEETLPLHRIKSHAELSTYKRERDDSHSLSCELRDRREKLTAPLFHPLLLLCSLAP